LQTVTQTYTSDYRIRGSKFFGYLGPAANQDDVENFLGRLRNEHPSASHHCYAWRLNPSEPLEFDQDDGEPRGTAGLPILNVMRSAHLMNAVLVSVRYFGGTKLGKPGLIEAYGKSSELCIKNAVLKRIIPVETWLLRYEYTEQTLVNKLRNDFPIIELESTYLEDITIEFACPANINQKFSAALNGFEHKLTHLEHTGTSYHIEQ